MNGEMSYHSLCNKTGWMKVKKKNDVTVMKDMIKWKFKLKVQSSCVSKVIMLVSKLEGH